MALGTPVAGAAAYSASGGTSVAPAYPSGILATDAVLLFVGQKPSTANGGTVTTPSGWTLREELTAAGGYGTTLGADTGNTNLRVYSWNSPVAGQTGTLSVTLGTNNVTWAFIVRIPTGGGTLSYGSADGQRTTAPTSPMSIALTNGAAATDFQAGDKAIWAMCIPTDVTTPSQFSAQSITATGATFATATELNEPDSTTGNDIGGYSAYAHVDSGSSTTAPTVTATLAGTLTNVRGPVVLVRVREAAPAAITGTLSATETGSDTFSGAGDVIVDGDFTATEAGADTFDASGTVTDAAITGSLAATEEGSDSFSATADLLVQGSLSVTEAGADTLAAIGQVIAQGTFAVTEVGSDTFAGTGGAVTQGSLAVTETGADTISSEGVVRISGTAGLAEAGADTFTATGSVGDPAITGTLAATETGSDTLSSAGQVLVQGDAAATEAGADTTSVSGAVLVQGTSDLTETGSDTFTGGGSGVSTGTLAAQEAGSDTAALSGAVLVQGAAAATEAGSDTMHAWVVPGYVESGYVLPGTVGQVLVQGDLAATETGSDTFAASGTELQPVTGTLAATETGADAASATGVLGARPFGPPDWEYRPNTGGGPIGPFTVQRKRRRPQQQEDDSLAVDPWDQQFREIALAEDAEISEFLFGLVSSGVLDGHV